MHYIIMLSFSKFLEIADGDLDNVMLDIFYNCDNSMYVCINKEFIAWTGYLGCPSRQRQKLFKLIDKCDIKCLCGGGDFSVTDSKIYIVAGVAEVAGDEQFITVKDVKKLLLRLPTHRGQQARGFTSYFESMVSKYFKILETRNTATLVH